MDWIAGVCGGTENLGEDYGVGEVEVGSVELLEPGALHGPDGWKWRFRRGWVLEGEERRMGRVGLGFGRGEIGFGSIDRCRRVCRHRIWE